MKIFLFKNCYYIKVLVLAIILLGLTQQNATADVFELADNQKAYGQLIFVAPEAIILETQVITDRSIKAISFPRSKVLRVTDENGTILFESNKKQVDNLDVYYKPILSNWETLKDKFVGSKTDSVLLLSGEKFKGLIIDINDQFIFVEDVPAQVSRDKIAVVKKINLDKVNQISKHKVIFTNPEKIKPKRKIKTKYPVYSFSFAPVYIKSDFDQLQSLFQNYYDDNLDQDYKAAKRTASFIGLQAKVEFYVWPSVSMGLSAHFFNKADLNSLALVTAEAKYIFYKTPLRPWLGLGFAGQDISSTEKKGDEKFTWSARKSSLTVGAGLELGKELGYGVALSVYYMPFLKERTIIGDAKSLKKIDFSLLMISLGLRYNINFD